MSRHIFRATEFEFSHVRSVSLCGQCFSTREWQAATLQQVPQAPECRECRRRRKEKQRR